MREIKFRVWCKQTEEMNNVLRLGFSEGELWYVEDNDFETQPPYFYDSDDWELMQYTCLKDKNGKEIYEGDIVKSKNESEQCETDYIDQVIYEKGRFILRDIFRDKYERLVDIWIGDNDICELEVIGNIYENQELL